MWTGVSLNPEDNGSGPEWVLLGQEQFYDSWDLIGHGKLDQGGICRWILHPDYDMPKTALHLL